MKKYQMYINGAFFEGARKETLESINPSNEEVIASFPKASLEDAREAIDVARLAFDKGEWPCLSHQERGQYLLKIAQAIRQEAKALSQIESMSTGKTLKQTTFIDIPTCASTFEYFAFVASELKGETIPVPAPALSLTQREPTGVVASIIPWNYPLIMFAWKIAPALACGNTVVLKPSQFGCLSILELTALIDKIGLPKGVVNVITGDGKELGPELAANPKVDMISFTGSTNVGKEIMRLASNNTKKIHLELGGKSPNIVFADCDLEAALGGAMSAIFMNQGQMCTAGSRLLIEESIHDKFLKCLIEKTKRLKIGNSLDYTTDFGPLISREHRQNVLKFIETGVKEKASLVCGGKIPSAEQFKKGFYLEPTIFANVENSMTIAQEEIFGPVLSVIKFTSVEEAIKIANDTKYGLAAMVWTKDLNKANMVAKKLQVGTVWINTYGGFYNEAPFGGYKQSGIGRELGKEGLWEYTQLKHINLDLTEGGKSLVTTWFG
ncbi:MAG: aldehyde dehydrogenase family protein [Candidatus Omnitrophota bacterium]|nr:aldehyde dehydrogenase family protein [Candidatus Omnitrophota bacterium]